MPSYQPPVAHFGGNRSPPDFPGFCSTPLTLLDVLLLGSYLPNPPRPGSNELRSAYNAHGKLLNKIWAGQCVDFEEILHNLDNLQEGQPVCLEVDNDQQLVLSLVN